MKRFLVLVCLLACGCVSDRVHTNYQGPDAGDLVVSVGWSQIAPFMLYYRKVGQLSGMRGFGGDGSLMVDFGTFGRAMDFDEGDEHGQVQVQHLEPGNYEIYRYMMITDGGGADAEETYSTPDFSIPFTIAPGKATYIGDFKLVPDMVDGLFGTKRVIGGTFVVTDKHGRDLPIAQRQDSTLRPVTDSVFDVSGLGLPTFVPGN